MSFQYIYIGWDSERGKREGIAVGCKDASFEFKLVGNKSAIVCILHCTYVRLGGEYAVVGGGSWKGL